MKKQYKAVWMNTDGNQHDLWPLFAASEEEAKQQALEFMSWRWGSFANKSSLKIKNG